MTPVAKRFPTTLVAYQKYKGKNLNTVQACAAPGKNLRKCCIRQFVGRLLNLQFSTILDQKQFIFAILIRVLIALKSKLSLDLLQPVAQPYGQVRTDWNQGCIIDCSLSFPAGHKPFTCSHSVLRNT